jgi:hypothetical protein
VIISIREYKDGKKGVARYRDGVCYRIETSEGRWVLHINGIPARDSYGHPLVFDMLWDAECYLYKVLGIGD